MVQWGRNFFAAKVNRYNNRICGWEMKDSRASAICSDFISDHNSWREFLKFLVSTPSIQLVIQIVRVLQQETFWSALGKHDLRPLIRETTVGFMYINSNGTFLINFILRIILALILRHFFAHFL